MKNASSRSLLPLAGLMLAVSLAGAAASHSQMRLDAAPLWQIDTRG